MIPAQQSWLMSKMVDSIIAFQKFKPSNEWLNRYKDVKTQLIHNPEIFKPNTELLSEMERYSYKDTVLSQFTPEFLSANKYNPLVQKCIDCLVYGMQPINLIEQLLGVINKKDEYIKDLIERIYKISV